MLGLGRVSILRRRKIGKGEVFWSEVGDDGLFGVIMFGGEMVSSSNLVVLSSKFSMVFSSF